MALILFLLICLHAYGAVQQSGDAEFRKSPALLKDSQLKEESWHTTQAHIAQSVAVAKTSKGLAAFAG